jgi:hypothetical protein
MCYQYVPPDYDGYKYPVFAKVLGNILAMIPIIPLPVVMIYQIWQAKGSFKEVKYTGDVYCKILKNQSFIK